jgi:uncharacterized membrane protein
LQQHSCTEAYNAVLGLLPEETEQVCEITQHKSTAIFITFFTISVSLKGTGIVGGFFSTLMPSFGGSRIFGFKGLAFILNLEDKTMDINFQYFVHTSH